jgi:hypothetical protein
MKLESGIVARDLDLKKHVTKCRVGKDVRAMALIRSNNFKNRKPDMISEKLIDNAQGLQCETPALQKTPSFPCS